MGKIVDSVSRLLQTKGLRSQIQTQLLLSIMPFMVSYTAFFYFWVFLDWDLLDSLTPTSLIFSIGTILYMMYSHSIREEGVSIGYGPCNLTLRWSASSITEESNVILGYVSLHEKEDEDSIEKLETLRRKLPKATRPAFLRPQRTDRVFKVYVFKSRVHNFALFVASMGVVIGLFGLYILCQDMAYWHKDFMLSLFGERRGEEMGMGFLLTKLGFGEEANLKLIDYAVVSMGLIFLGFLASFISRTSVVKMDELTDFDKKLLKVKPPKEEKNPGENPTVKPIPEGIGDVLVGTFFSLCVFHREMESPLYGEDKTFRMIAFIHDYPFDNVFRKIPGQLISYKGLVFETAAVKLDSTFCFWDEEVEACPIFRVTSDPEQTRLMQIGLAIKPTTEKTDVEEVGNLRSAHQAIKYAMRLRNVESAYKQTVEGYRDSREEAVAIVDRVLDNREEIRRKKGRLAGLTKGKLIAYVIVGALLTLFVLWAMGVI